MTCGHSTVRDALATQPTKQPRLEEPVLAVLAMAALASAPVLKARLKPLQETTDDAANVDSRDSVITVSLIENSEGVYIRILSVQFH